MHGREAGLPLSDYILLITALTDAKPHNLSRWPTTDLASQIETMS